MTIPDDARAQLDALANGIAEELGQSLVGVYVHGSLVLGCFNPQRSDVDVLAVTRRALDEETRWRIAPILLRSSGPKAALSDADIRSRGSSARPSETTGRHARRRFETTSEERPRTPPYPLEISFLTEEQLRTWRYPTPYDVHFSESWRPRLDDGSWPNGGEDYDLAAHITLIRAAGITLHGPPPIDVFPEVPHADFVDSLLRDLDWCREQNWKLYSALSASRIWATLSDGDAFDERVDRSFQTDARAKPARPESRHRKRSRGAGGLQSKETGAVWALERAPAEFRPLIEHALAVYRGEIDDAEFDLGQANRYVDFVREQLT